MQLKFGQLVRWNQTKIILEQSFSSQKLSLLILSLLYGELSCTYKRTAPNLLHIQF